MRFIRITGAESGGFALVNLDHILVINEVTPLIREDNPGKITPACNTYIQLDASKTAGATIHCRETLDEVLDLIEEAITPLERHPERFGD